MTQAQKQTLKQEVLQKLKAVNNADLLILVRELLRNYMPAPRKTEEDTAALYYRIAITELLGKELQPGDLALIRAFCEGVYEAYTEQNTTP